MDYKNLEKSPDFTKLMGTAGNCAKVVSGTRVRAF